MSILFFLSHLFDGLNFVGYSDLLHEYLLDTSGLRFYIEQRAHRIEVGFFHLARTDHVVHAVVNLVVQRSQRAHIFRDLWLHNAGFVVVEVVHELVIDNDCLTFGADNDKVHDKGVLKLVLGIVLKVELLLDSLNEPAFVDERLVREVNVSKCGEDVCSVSWDLHLFSKTVHLLLSGLQSFAHSCLLSLNRSARFENGRVKDLKYLVAC